MKISNKNIRNVYARLFTLWAKVCDFLTESGFIKSADVGGDEELGGRARELECVRVRVLVQNVYGLVSA